MGFRDLFRPVDMTEGAPAAKIVAFTIPMLIGNIAQQLYNTVDSIIVGRFVGDNALAAVGSAGPILNLLLVLFVGISIGAGIMVSQYFGARQREELSLSIGCCITMTFIASLIIMVAAPLISLPMLRLLDTPAETLENATLYLRIYFFGVPFMMVLNIKLALLTFILVPFVSALMITFRKTIGRIFHLQYKKNDDVASELQDVISGMRVVKTYGKEKDESERFKSVSGIFADIQKKNERFWAMFDFLVNVLMGMGLVIVVYFGGLDVFNYKMTPGELYQFIAYTLLLFQYIGWLGRLPREISRLTSSLERIYDVLAQDVPEESDTVKDIDIKGEITFDHATFGYKSYRPVLEDINAVVKPGEMIGIVGASGTGKSTLINLLMRLYETDDGRILVDGTDMKDISRKSYHSQLGVVLQETFLFSGTIIDNIRFSKPDATTEEIIRAAKLANAHDFICALPDGYNTYVGEKGYTLSGGERQRIAIARAILPDPRILILDEATASLDTESEFMIQKALERLTKGKTTFAIAHRLSTLKNADRIMVIDGHHIAEIGTHSELLDRKGIYYNLYTAQIQI